MIVRQKDGGAKLNKQYNEFKLVDLEDTQKVEVEGESKDSNNTVGLKEKLNL